MGASVAFHSVLRHGFRLGVCAAIVIGCGLPNRLDAATKIDFSLEDDGVTPLLNGQMIDQNEEFGILFEVLASGSNAGAAIFDSTPGVNPADPDLWVDLGNILILQSNSGNDAASTGDFFDSPNDDADSNNIVSFNFFQSVMMEAIDLVDVDQNGPVTVTLTDAQGRARTYVVPANWTYEISDPNLPVGGLGYDTLDLTSLADQPGEGGSVATATEDAGFDAADVQQLKVEFDGSGGLDNLVFVPEPSTACLLAIGVFAVLRRRRPISH